ncbi:HDOD domain-containing protein [Candidatus Thiodiazotropha sp. CDECU1]|uniref:HDOD domain-containing protein n=1 Tax=Candidatus Thiodiazotropha sp. CDECU1 TaxID=3065865 RepID=UPI00293188A1|nr:HDOD domain-containing protein [Candidatus Thiodiazotropha sp. CDECU1]
MHQSNQAKYRVQKLQYLPPLSATATRLLAMLGDDSFSLEDLALVINQDPGLTARILGLANSAYFAQQNPILSIEDAIIRVLGLNLVKSLSFSIAVTGAFESSGCRSFDLQEYWNHSLSIAMLSRQISLAVSSERKPDAEAAYLAGLLFDIGVLILVHEFPEEYARVLLQSKQQPDRSRLELETEIIGIDHRQAGMWLGHRWHLPEVVVNIIAQSVDGKDDADSLCETLLVGGVAEWVKTPLPTELKLTQPLPGMEQNCGLSEEQLETIKAGFIHKEEEIRVLAKLLAK